MSNNTESTNLLEAAERHLIKRSIEIRLYETRDKIYNETGNPSPSREEIINRILLDMNKGETNGN